MSQKNAITPRRSEDYPLWYQQVIKEADLAENAPVRGCMVIKPWGCTLWENIQRVLDRKFKDTGHKNAYFPLLIPKSYLEKEAQHVEGFAKECAVVTHSRLKANEEGQLIPDSPLDEPLIVRPTSETIIGAMFSQWIKSYRDLPLLLNQWANVVRWEMRPRLFLRTSEFLWQEGHTAHETAEEAMEETLKMLQVYSDFCEEYMAMPVIQGEKPESERFPGADATFCIEAMMQDGKALQAGTSHFLGQNFARASNITFLNQEGHSVYAWTSSWGVSTRLIGGLIMTHGDDDGIILPPRLAPLQVVILPVIHKEDTRAAVLDYCDTLEKNLREIVWHGQPIEVEIDKRAIRGGEKMWSWIKKGVPIRLEIGPRDMDSDSICLARRDESPKQKQNISRPVFINTIKAILDDIQNNLLQRAKQFRDNHTETINSQDAFYEYFRSYGKDEPHIQGGFACTHWNSNAEIEARLKSELKVTIRCIPKDDNKEEGICPFTGERSNQLAIWAKAY